MRLKVIGLALAITALGGGAGCSHIIKRSIKEAKGASSKAAAVPGTLTTDFKQFKGVRVDFATTELGGLVDGSFMSAVKPMVIEQLAKIEGAPLPGGEPALEVTPHVMWYNERGALGGLMGSDSHAVGMFVLKSNGNEVGRVQVVTKSGASRTEPPDMAESMAEGLRRYIVRIRDGISEEEQEKADKERKKRREEEAERRRNEEPARNEARADEVRDEPESSSPAESEPAARH